MAHDGDLRFLSNLPYFRGLAAAELAQIAEHCHARQLDAGELLMLEGQPAEALYAVRSGSIRVFKTAIKGRKEQTLIVLGAGETFNDVPAFDGGPNPASAQALAQGTSVYTIPVGLVTHLLATNPRVSANVIHVLAARLRHLTMLVEDLSFRHVTQRLARLLVEESDAAGAVLLTQQEMATRIGTVREMVSRALRELERRTAVSRRDGGVRVDTAALRAFLEGDGLDPQRGL